MEIDLSGIQPTLAPQNTTARKFAEMLMSQNTQPQGQMISGRYVKPSFFQQLQPVANMLTGAYLNTKADEQAQQYADAIRKLGAKETADILGLVQGKEAIAAQPEYLPQGQTLRDDQGELTYGAKPAIQAQAAIPGDAKAALAKALIGQTPQARALVAPLLQNALPKKTDQLINYETYKSEGGKLPFTDWLDRNEKARLEIDRQRLGLEFANANKPQIVETANGFVAVNPRNPNQAVPVMLNGQPLVGSKGNLPEGATGQLTGVQNVKSALNDLKSNLKTFSTFDMVNPDKRALMATDYENTILQLKEAMKLGVLNGNDYTILTSMITDPNSPKALLLSKETQMKQIDNMEKKLNDMTSNVYKTHQRSVPSNLQTPVMETPAPTNAQAPKLKYNLETGKWE